MEQRNTKKSKRSKTKIIPPKKKRPESLSRDEVRSINKKRIKRKRKAERLAVRAALALVVLSIGLILVLTLFFRIETITIKGDRVYTDKEILLQSGIEVGDSLIGVRESKLDKTLSKNLPYIGEVKIEKKLPDKLIISITATREIVAFQSGSGFILIDAEGKVIDKDASILRENVGVVSGIKPKTVNEGELIGFSDEKTSVAFSTLLTAIKESGLNLITEINFDGSGKWILKYDDRITIKVFADDKIGEKLKLAVRSIEMENARNPYVEGVLDFTKATDGVFGSADETTKPPSTDVSGGVSGETTTSKTE